MKPLLIFITIILLLFQNCTLFESRENSIASRYPLLDIVTMQKCNQIYITDSNVFLLLYDYADSSAYNPFRIDPFLLCYDNKLELQWCKFVDALKIISIKNDTILLLGRCNTKTTIDIIESQYLKYIPIPSAIGTICYKVIDSMKLDLISGNVLLKYREYNDKTIGLAIPHFFEDMTNTYLTKKIKLNHYDIIFNSQDEPDYSVRCIKTLDLKSNNMYHDIWILNDSNMLLKFYNNFYDYIITKKNNCASAEWIDSCKRSEGY